MNQIIQKQLTRDYEITLRRLEEIEQNGNNTLVRARYLEGATDATQFLPLEHQRGEYRHLVIIADALETALIEGKLTAQQLPPRAPAYLQNLVLRERG